MYKLCWKVNFGLFSKCKGMDNVDGRNQPFPSSNLQSYHDIKKSVLEYDTL